MSSKQEEAIDAYQQARERYSELEREANVANVLLGMGLSHREQGRYDQAIDYLEQSRDLYHKLQRPIDIADLWNGLGITYRMWGKQEEAIEAFEHARERYSELEREVNVANVLLSMGRLYEKREQYDLALTQFDESYQLYQKLDLPENIVSSLRYKAQALHGLGRSDQAIQLALQSIDRAEAGEYMEQMANTHETLVEIYAGIGDIERAEYHADQAIALYGRKERDIADVHVELAKGLIDAERFEQSEELLADALAIYTEFNRLPDIAKTMRELGKLYMATLQTEQAQEWLQESLTLFTQMQMEQEMATTTQLLDSVP